MDNNKDEKEIKENSEVQEEILEQTIENKIEEEKNHQEIEKQENYIQENIEAEVENTVEIEQSENIEETTKVEDIIQTESEENNKNKTKCINLWLLLIPLVLVMLVLIYIFTDLFKTDEQNFAKYMYIASTNIENLKSEELEKYFEKTKYTSEGSIIANCYGEELNVKFNGNTDVENRLKETNITTDYGKEEIEINYKQDNDIYAIKIDDLYNKYIAIENNNLKELANSLGLDSDNVPDEMNLEKYKFTEEELKDIKQRYTKIIKNEINKENYSSKKIDDYTIYKLNITNEQLNNIKIKILQELKNDSLILDKYVIYEEINGNQIEKEDLQKEIESKIIELEEGAFVLEEAVVISLYTKLNKCEKIEMKLSEEIIVIEMYSNSLKITSEQEDNELSFEIQREETLKELKYNIKIEGQNYNLDISLKYSDLSKNTVKEDYDVNLNFDNDNINLKYTNTTSQDEKLVINQLENSECEILNNLNKNEINELIYKIYGNMISL